MKTRHFAVPLALLSVAAGAPASAQENTAALAAEVAEMRARLAALEAKLAAAETKAAEEQKAEKPSWKGAPQFSSGGWSFKPRGRLQYDAGWVSRPDGLADLGLGFSNELRRARLGVEGTMPGGFGYVFELDFADNNVEITDAILTYKASDSVGLTIGQHNNFQSLEELTSSRFTSFVERAAFTDAFNFERRVGLSAAFASGDFLAQGGVFTDNINDLTEDADNAVGIDGRIVYAPKLGEAQLHLGASAHWRDNGDLADAGAATRYRQRPLIHSTDVRFIGTPALPVEQETQYGLEAAFISGPFHAAAEAHWINADLLSGGPSPTFFGGYAEVGYFLTGETRGYRGGRFDRTKVLEPVGDGGIGAFQINLRYDHLDLIDAGVVGGRQRGYLASLIWIPHDHVRFLINYGHLDYSDAAIPAAGGERDYNVDVVGARAQVDF